jgi:hypothetical protein
MVNSPFLFVVSFFKRLLLTFTPGKGSLVIESTTIPLIVSSFIFLGNGESEPVGGDLG